jgi:hypothetical protein
LLCCRCTASTSARAQIGVRPALGATPREETGGFLLIRSDSPSKIARGVMSGVYRNYLETESM